MVNESISFMSPQTILLGDGDSMAMSCLTAVIRAAALPLVVACIITTDRDTGASIFRGCCGTSIESKR